METRLAEEPPWDQPMRMLASSSVPWKNSAVPPCEPITTGSLLAIAPTAPLFEKDTPSTISRTSVLVLTHWTVCHWPSLITGPWPTLSLQAREPLNPHEAVPLGWYSI